MVTTTKDISSIIRRKGWESMWKEKLFIQVISKITCHMGKALKLDRILSLRAFLKMAKRPMASYRGKTSMTLISMKEILLRICLQVMDC